MGDEQTNTRRPIVLRPGDGRSYAMPTMRAVFKADGDETANRYSISEWWLKPESDGPGAHSHEGNDEIFYVIEGTPSVLIGDDWIDAPVGTCIVIPAGITHDFANRTKARAGLFNVFIPGDFEKNMPAVVKWFEENAEK
jgi:mannose-6-phosphate isomerase-like protein (cupin superfamily)